VTFSGFIKNTQETSGMRCASSGRSPVRGLGYGGLLALAVMAGGVTSAMGQSAAATGRVYVSSEKDNKLQVFDVRGEHVGTIDVCKRPRHMMFTPDRRRILVSCGDSNRLGIVDMAGAKMVDTLALGESPEIFDLGPGGDKVYVSIEDENVLAAYDLQARKRVFEVPTGGEPEGVLVTPDGKYAYVTSEVANMVHCIDLAQKKVIRSVKVGKRPRRLALVAGGAELWVTNELDAAVSVIDTARWQVKASIRFAVAGMRDADITPVGMVLAPDGRSVWVGLGRANRVAEVAVTSRQVTRQVLVGRRAWGLAMHPDGRTLYVVNGLSDDMTLVDVAAGKAVRTVAVGRVPHSVLVSP
jgi:PQQ-dependent catabolism-associated beta-propeller protein